MLCHQPAAAPQGHKTCIQAEMGHRDVIQDDQAAPAEDDDQGVQDEDALLLHRGAAL